MSIRLDNNNEPINIAHYDKRRKKKKNHLSLELKNITPKTDTQTRVFHSFNKSELMFLHGYAGTGKTFISLYLALQELQTGNAERLIIVRSSVPTREMGFLPGTEKEKMKVYEAPYAAMATELFGRGDAYECLRTRKSIDFISTSYVRGCTFNDAIVLVDETQNMSFQELDTIITRLGENSKIVFCGDYKQSDLKNSGLKKFLDVVNQIPDIMHVEFSKEDIVRSELVKKYIIAKDFILE
jgi:phosphate starvation-inducible PhoH-like protein